MSGRIEHHGHPQWPLPHSATGRTASPEVPHATRPAWPLEGCGHRRTSTPPRWRRVVRPHRHQRNLRGLLRLV